MPVGVNTGESEFNTVNKTGGVKAVTLTVTQIPSHTHKPVGGGDFVGVDSTAGQKFGFAGGNYVTFTWKTGGVTANSGGSSSHNNLQPYITCYFWRRTA